MMAAVGTTRPALEISLEHEVGSLRLHVEARIGSERAAIFGTSGSGKTTLLRALAGLLRLKRGRIVLTDSAGSLLLLDTDTGIDLPPGHRQIGFVTQTPALFPHLSVAGNIAFGLHGKEASRREGKVEELASMFALEPLLSRLPQRLSGGEQQRVALARALAREPRLLLLDEPFSGLDGSGKQRAWAALEAYRAKRPMMTLLVSHDVGEVWSHADTVLRIHSGQVEDAQGSPAEILAAERADSLRQLDAL